MSVYQKTSRQLLIPVLGAGVVSSAGLVYILHSINAKPLAGVAALLGIICVAGLAVTLAGNAPQSDTEDA